LYIKAMKLVITMLAAIFAYSCTIFTSGESSYYAKIAKADLNLPYTSLYPDVIIEPEGYFLNKNARYGGQYGEDICISRAGGRDSTIANCVKNDEQDSFHGASKEKMKKWLKSKNTPYNEAINREILDKVNDLAFLGFYPVGEQLYYIYVSFRPGE